jgi:hypothetical protein
LGLRTINYEWFDFIISLGVDFYSQVIFASHKTFVQIRVCTGVIKIGGNILSRKLPKHLKTISTGRNCELKNSKFTSFRPVVDANEERKRNDKKKTQLKRLPRKKFDTDTELSWKNVRVQSTFTFSVVKC